MGFSLFTGISYPSIVYKVLAYCLRNIKKAALPWFERAAFLVQQLIPLLTYLIDFAVPISPTTVAHMAAAEVLDLSSALISSRHASKRRWNRVSSALFTIFRSRPAGSWEQRRDGRRQDGQGIDGQQLGGVGKGAAAPKGEKRQGQGYSAQQDCRHHDAAEPYRPLGGQPGGTTFPNFLFEGQTFCENYTKTVAVFWRTDSVFFLEILEQMGYTQNIK